MITSSVSSSQSHFTETQRFKGSAPSADPFTALFPHRHDFIWANHVAPEESVQWRTERRYPLSDRVLDQGSHLYGVRFGARTNYCLFDIDAGSHYHPHHDPFAISRLLEALEPLDLVSYVPCTSSYSGGLHLYFPFETPQSSWLLALVVSVLLENAGFILKPGQLEVFPNPKPYQLDRSFSLFNAHRLPMQTGSYLLNSAFEPIWSTQSRFVECWQSARSRNGVETPALKRILKQAKRQPFQLSGKAGQFLNDLNAEIEVGWTGAGQTNWLLGRITMREYVFRHVLSGGTPLSGTALSDAIVSVAEFLPGYTEFCNHQHEIEHRAVEWARCIEKSHYFHYGDACGKYKSHSQEVNRAIETAPTWNQQQIQSAREKIGSAIADLLEQEKLPSTATKRFEKLLQYKIGGGSLYRHKDLWHPQFLTLEPGEQISSSLYLEGLTNTQQEIEIENEPQSLPSLLPGNGGNASHSHDFSDLNPSSTETIQTENDTPHLEPCLPTDFEAQLKQKVNQFKPFFNQNRDICIQDVERFDQVQRPNFGWCFYQWICWLLVLRRSS